ncbi:MAG: archease [Acidimicrobiia bacterium]
MPAARGHRILPHTADLIVEAWAATRAACMEEAVTAMVEAFADTGGAEAAEPVPVALDAAGDEDLLVGVLEEVIYLVEVLGVMPTAVAIAERDDGGVSGCFDVVPLAEAEEIGAVPKAIARGHLTFGPDADGRWGCRVTIDV